MNRAGTTPSPWRVLLPAGLGTALSLMGDSAMYAVLPTHTAAAGVALASVGVLLSANRWIRLGTNGLAGWAYDRWPRRRLFVPALFVGALSTALYAFTDGFWPLLVGRLLWGLAWSGIWVGGNHMLLEASPPAERGRWMGLYQLSFYLGGVLGFPAAGLLTDQLGYHPALAVAAGMTLLGAVVALFWLPETRPASAPAPQPVAQLDPASATPLPARGWRDQIRDEQGRRTLWPITLMYGLNRFVNAGIITGTLALWVQQRWGGAAGAGEASLTGLLLGLSTFTSMLSAPVAGQWSDRRAGRWRVAAALLLPGLAGAALLASGAPWLILLAVPLNAIAGGSSQGLATALLGDAAQPAVRGRALGWVHTFGDLTSALAPILAYWAMRYVGLPVVYVVCGVLIAGMALWAWRLGQRLPQPTPA